MRRNLYAALAGGLFGLGLLFGYLGAERVTCL